MIHVRNMTKELLDAGVVFSGVNLDIEPGEFVAVLGSSGSGKSTFLRCLSTRESWTKGKLFYKDGEIFEMGWKGRLLMRREWAYMEEQPQLNRRKNAIKNVLAGSRIHRPWWRLLTGMVSEDEYVSGMDYLEMAGLLKKADKRPIEKLSGGEVQRVAIAKALAQRAQVVVADGPISNLDPHTGESILADIRKLCEKENLIFICALNQVELAEKYATRLLGLANHNVVFDITGRRLTQQEKRQIL